jgi:hypothetical protein
MVRKQKAACGRLFCCPFTNNLHLKLYNIVDKIKNRGKIKPKEGKI